MELGMNKQSRFKSFLLGLSSTLDLYGTIYHDESMKILQRTDMRALAQDWQMVGEDMRRATEIYNDANNKA